MTLSTPTLRAWADSLGCPSPYPYWVKVRGLSNAKYNGRVGRALGPPNEQGWVAVEMDAGLGELSQSAVRRWVESSCERSR